MKTHFFLHRSLIVKSQSNRIEFFTRPYNLTAGLGRAHWNGSGRRHLKHQEKEEALARFRDQPLHPQASTNQAAQETQTKHRGVLLESGATGSGSCSHTRSAPYQIFLSYFREPKHLLVPVCSENIKMHFISYPSSVHSILRQMNGGRW